MPWRELPAHSADQNNYVISDFHAAHLRDVGRQLVAVLIIWTAFASVFSLLLGYSRVPYAAALDGNYFPHLRARPSRRHAFPTVSLLALGGVAMLFCFLRLADVIAALVVIRIMLQFLVQAVGVIVLRRRRPGHAATLPHVALSAAGAVGDCRVSVCAAIAKEFCAGNPVRGGHSDCGTRDLPGALVATSRVAVCRGDAIGLIEFGVRIVPSLRDSIYLSAYPGLRCAASWANGRVAPAGLEFRGQARIPKSRFTCRGPRWARIADITAGRRVFVFLIHAGEITRRENSRLVTNWWPLATSAQYPQSSPVTLSLSQVS